MQVSDYKKYCFDRNGNPCLFDYHRYLEDRSLTHEQYDRWMMSFDNRKIKQITKAVMMDMIMDMEIVLREEVEL